MNNSSGKTLSISIAGFAAVLVGLILLWSPREAKSVTAQGFWYGRHLDDASADIAGIEALTYAPGSELFYAVVAGDESAGTLTFVALSPQFEPVNSWTVSGALTV